MSATRTAIVMRRNAGRLCLIVLLSSGAVDTVCAGEASTLAPASTSAAASAAASASEADNSAASNGLDQSALALRGTLTSPQMVALITDPKLGEISGIAPSRRHPGLFWVHNDSGNGARLFAIDRHGERKASLKLDGARNIDWEDMASFNYQGHDYLLVADTGDNGGLRRKLSLHVFEEPATLGESREAVSWTIRFRWPDGPRDCEAVAVDAAAGWVYLVSKKRIPAELWRVPLAASDEVAIASPVATLGGIIQPDATDLKLNPVFGRYRAQVTAADISPDGMRLAVLNYRRVYIYQRNPDGSWPGAQLPPSEELDLPWLPQAEAVTFDPDGHSVWVSSERLPAPLLRLPVGVGAEIPSGD